MPFFLASLIGMLPNSSSFCRLSALVSGLLAQSADTDVSSSKQYDVSGLARNPYVLRLKTSVLPTSIRMAQPKVPVASGRVYKASPRMCPRGRPIHFS
jgi:hypothetical protein